MGIESWRIFLENLPIPWWFLGVIRVVFYLTIILGPAVIIYCVARHFFKKGVKR